MVKIATQKIKKQPNSNVRTNLPGTESKPVSQPVDKGKIENIRTQCEKKGAYIYVEIFLHNLMIQ
jgi:hypothetical protein